MINETNEIMTPIAITLGTDDNGDFVSMTVWASESRVIFNTYDLQSDEAQKWLSKIELKECEKYYSL